MKKILINLFIASLVVSLLFLFFYYSIGRLYILRLGIVIGEPSVVVFSPPRMFDFLIFNITVGALSVVFYIATIIAEFAEKKVSGKSLSVKFDFGKFKLIPLFYFFVFFGGLIFSSHVINNIDRFYPYLDEEEIFSKINDYREKFEKLPLEYSEVACNIADQKINELGKYQASGIEFGGEGFKKENNILYAFNYIKNVGRNQQALFWWQHDLALNDIMKITNFEGEEITKGCVKTKSTSDSSVVVFVSSSK